MSEYYPPGGDRYSQLYMERPASRIDSARARARVGATFRYENRELTTTVREEIVKRLGCDFEFAGYAHDIEKFLTRCSLPDFLDAISVIHQAIVTNSRGNRLPARAWISACDNAFVEENLPYRVNSAGVVHPFVDVEFTRNLESLIAGLDRPSLGAVRAEVQRSIDQLNLLNPDTKGAVRAIFEAIEIAAKLIAPTVPRLTDRTVRQQFLPIFLKAVEGDQVASTAVKKMAEGLCDWVDAAHIYRHGHGVAELSAPPIDLAIVMISSGASYLRWVIGAASTQNRLDSV